MATTLSGERRNGSVRMSYRNGNMTIEEDFHYQVKSDNKNTTRLEILQTAGLPLPGQSFTDLGLVIGTDCDRNEQNPLIWDVVITTSSDADQNSQNNPAASGADPNTWVPVYETFLEPYEEYPVVAVNGKPYVNGAGQPFSIGTPVTKNIIRWEFFQFEDASTVTDSVISSRHNTINSATFTRQSKAKHTLKLEVKRSVVGYYYGSLRRKTDYSLSFKEDNWHSRIANVGSKFIHNNKLESYRYSDSPDELEVGPLGTRNYTYDEDLDDAAGAPTYGTTTVGNKVYAQRGVNTLYYIERQSFEELDFNTFLR